MANPVAFKKENSDYYLMIIVGEKCKIALFLLLYKGVLGSLLREEKSQFLEKN